MKHGGKREGAGRKKAAQTDRPNARPPALSVVQGGSPPVADGPDEPDWTQLFVDELDIRVARQQWRILITELRLAEKLATANYSHIKRTVFHQVMWERAARQVAEVDPPAPSHFNPTNGDTMNSDTVWQIIRYILIAGGSFATGKGWVTADQVTTIVGALGSLFAVAWGLFVKSGTKAVPEATAARSDVPTVSAATGAVQR